MTTSIEAWLVAACADAERRGLADLKPLLEGMARSTTALRAADEILESEEAANATGQNHGQQPPRAEP